MTEPSSSVQRKTLVLLRHAHRDSFSGVLDNALSATGLAQAMAVAAYFKKRYGDEKPHCIASPRIRCRQTLAPLAAAQGVSVHIDPLLQETERKEPNERFLDRITSFLTWWKKQAPGLVIACSHGDWIPDALALLGSIPHDLRTASWTEIELDGDDVRVKPTIQDVRSEMSLGDY